MRVHILLLPLVFAATSWLAAQSLEQQIRSEVLRYVETVNRGDPAALANLYLDDSTVGSLGDGQIYKGWKTIAELLKGIYQEVGAIRMAVDSVTVTPLGDDVAVAFFRYYWILGIDDPQSFAGAMTIAFRRTANGWRVAHDHTSTLLTEPVPTPGTSSVTDSGPATPVRQTTPCVVTRVVDGDTIECERVGRIRLIGMDTPEMSQEPYGALAAQALATLTPVGSEVQLEPDVEPRDRYGRVLAYIWVRGLMANWALVRQGWAVLLTYPPNVQYVEWFTEAQRLAREEGVGLWAVGGFECLPRDRRRGRCE